MGYSPIYSTRLNFGLQMIHTYEFLISTHFQPNGLQSELGYNPKYLTGLKFDGCNRKVATQEIKFGLQAGRVGWKWVKVHNTNYLALKDVIFSSTDRAFYKNAQNFIRKKDRLNEES